MKSIFSSRRNKSPHNNEEADKQEAPFFGKENKTPFFNTSGGAAVQTKLKVGQPGDKYEKEADRMADAVVNGSSKPELQKMDAPEEEEGMVNKMDAREEEEGMVNKMDGEKEEEGMISKMEGEEEEEMVQTKSNGTSQTANTELSQQIKTKAGKGQKLPKNTQAEMESSFGMDFSGINIHTDPDAVKMNKALRSQAFTHGRDIYFNHGKYDTQSTAGRHLLAHELTHTLQQSSTLSQSTPRVQKTIGDGLDLSSPRFKGDPDLEACFDDEKIIRVGSRGLFVAKVQRALVDAGFNLPIFGVDGEFGQETKAAVREFQRQSGLEAKQLDGEIGSTTMSRLDSRFTGASATKVQKTCEVGIKTVTIDVVMMKGATGNPTTDIAFANSVFNSCCIQFRLGKQVTMPANLSDFLMGGDTDFLVGDCGAVSAEDLTTFLTATQLFGLTNPIKAFYINTLHNTAGRQIRGQSVSPLCGTGPRAPMTGMMSIANGAGGRTFPHELAHILMNTFGDHSETADNVQHVSKGSTGAKLAPVQCAIMYSRV